MASSASSWRWPHYCGSVFPPSPSPCSQQHRHRRRPFIASLILTASTQPHRHLVRPRGLLALGAFVISVVAVPLMLDHDADGRPPS
jgi:hypothetical protein